MNWTELIAAEMESAYKAAAGLVDLVDDLDWKPATGQNWWTTGQLLLHMAGACGSCFEGFVTGEWAAPEDIDPATGKPETMLPPAEAYRSVASIAEAKEKLAADRQLALDMLARAGENRLANECVPAPWDPTPALLGRRLLQMIGHLELHKAQLFYYLKLQGKPVHTGHLFGM